MCGIAGFVGPYDLKTLKVMTRAIAHRGPDDEGHYHADLGLSGHSVGIGHRRLSIVDLKTGQQPIWNEDHTLAIIFNGEIYNYHKLRTDLKNLGHRFTTTTDTEVILHGYEVYGKAILDHLEGMFAFGIWDTRHQRWFLARDHFGIKPLYYCQPTSETFAFASEIKALLPLISSTQIDLRAFYHYLLYGWISTEVTIFQGIRQLLPAHYLSWDHQQLSVHCYWQLTDTEPVLSQSDWADWLYHKLYEAVNSHLVADVPVGITLSGGLDSSAVLSIMSQIIEPERIQAFTLGYGRADDETRFSRQAAAHLGVKAHERIIALPQIGEAFSQMLWHLEEPLAHPVMGTTFFLAQFVCEHLKVILIGEGSDELFAGYPHYQLFRPPYCFAPRSLIKPYFFAVAYLMPEVQTLAKLLHPDWLDLPLLKQVGQSYDHYFKQRNLPQGGLRCELENELVYNQLARIDKLTMAHSVEARVPFLDRTFAETAYNIPFKFKLKNGIEKYILRQSMRGRLPEVIRQRPKSGKSGTQALLPVLVGEALHSQVINHLAPEVLRKRGWFRPTAVQQYLAGVSAVAVRANPIESRRRLKFAYALTVIEEWGQLFLDGKRPA
jgi:asparagine synthase (glutamine-hydrolysing)